MKIFIINLLLFKVYLHTDFQGAFLLQCHLGVIFHLFDLRKNSQLHLFGKLKISVYQVHEKIYKNQAINKKKPKPFF